MTKKQLKKPKSRPEEEWEVSDFKNEDGNELYKITDTMNDSSEIYAVSMQEDTVLDKKNGKTNSEQSTERKKKFKSAQRSEAGDNISEFNLCEDKKETVILNEMIKTSQKLCGQDSVKKQLRKIKKLKKVSVPLSKQDLSKFKRRVAYEKVCDEVTRWQSVVNSNRVEEQIIFPLKKPDFVKESFEDATERFVTKHPVEIAVNELLKKSSNVLKKDREMTEAEEKALKAMSLEEARLRHNELMKHKALISYQQEKARRRNKIKSRRYRQLVRKEKVNKLLKEVEELEKVDPEKALEKIMEADRVRIMERVTLKHTNTGKWAKMLKLRAKYNPEARRALKEDIITGRKLREKLPAVEETISKLRSNSGMPSVHEIDNSIYNDGLVEDVTSSLNIEESGDIVPFMEVDDEAFVGISKHNKVSEDLHLENSKDAKKSKKKGNIISTEKNSDFIDMDFISKATVLDSCKPSSVSIGDHLDEVENDEDSMDEEESEGIKNVSEAFADEDIIAEFREDKKVAEDAKLPKELDLFLPGWGTWGGKGVKLNDKIRQRYVIKPPEEPAVKKRNFEHVIINEDKDKKASKHQVNVLPFPFTNVEQYESYIRQPIGYNWNPQSSFKNLIAPKVVTKPGQIIEPIDAEDFLLNKQQKNQEEISIKNTELNLF
ncbi:u3 small nucleolar RNA-associated protein 14 homolog A [Trichonephila inaurata madagascariensis]|uniref:U3 small nucleolar RNA-associated protein 14 homolog A n=1 Tax=Trichonephila inaurata madagascariensis TaxID=2747483 RepID=A0A8X6XC68_9ARAC|nr:u3 small nucleolar RNA-associated protein 14 homolog A [Trichonephila inaurata madagascariensis]